MKYDVIVVGAGLGGLAAASRLAILGHKVAVFEQYDRAGGYASNFTRNGYEFDISLHGIPGLLEGGNLYRMLKCCQVFDRITPLKYEHAYSVRIQNETIVIPNDIIAYKHMLLKRFPNCEAGILRLFKDLGHFEEGFQRYILGEKGLKGKLHRDSLLFIRWSKKSCYEVIKSYVEDEEFIRIFAAIWTNFGLPPKELSALTFFISWVSYHYHGKYYIEGGAKKLTDAFLEVMEEQGAKVYLNSNVVKLLDNGKAICGVQLESGEEIQANWVISNMNPKSSLNLINPALISNKLTRKVSKSIVGCSLTQLYLGLDCPTEEVGLSQEEIFVCGGNNHEEDYQMAMKNQYQKSGYLLTNYSGMDTSLNPKGLGVLTMTYIDHYDSWNLEESLYHQKKKEVLRQMLNRLQEDYPRLKGHIVVAELGTPKTMERCTKNVGGAVYGYSQTVKQTGDHRLQRETGILGFSFVGAWVSPGGGYEGTITGAIVEAQRIHCMFKKNCR